MKEVSWSNGAMTINGLDNEQNGPLVLCLHGFLDNAVSFEPMAEYLSDFHLIALDFAGHGKSEHRSDGAHYHLLDYIQDLYNLCIEQEWRDFVLVGHSMGGIVASIFTAAFGELVRGLICIDAGGPLTLPASQSTEQLRAAVMSRVPKAKRRIPVDLEAAIAARCKVSDIPEHHARRILQRNIGQDENGQYIWRSDSRLRTKSTLRLTDEQAEDFMRNIDCPTCFVGATKSFKQMEHVYEKRQAWMKSSQLVMLEGGHHIHMERPKDVSKAICSFVEQL